VIGSGRQALGQVAAVAAVRPIRRVTVYSPTLGNRERFAGIVEGLDLGCRVECSPSVQSAVDGAHVVTTVTRARQPFLEAGMLAPGAHVNAVGAVTPERRELATDVAARSKVVVADGVDAARRLAVELSEVEHITPLCDVVAAGDRFPGGDGSTVFKSMGVGLADLALGGVVLARCATSGRGRPLVATRRATPQLKEMS
jgi:alanine dehydrogenase